MQKQFDEARALDLRKKFQWLKILNPLIFRNFLGFCDRSLMLGLTNSTAPESINQPWCKNNLMMHVRWICAKNISRLKILQPPDFSKFSRIFWSFTHAWFDEFNRAWVNKPTLMQKRFDEARALDLRKKFQPLKILNPLILRNFLGFFDRSLMLGLTNSTAPESINQPWCKNNLMKHVRWICEKNFSRLKILNPLIFRNFLGFFDRSLMLGLTNLSVPESINQPWCKNNLMKHVRWICKKNFSDWKFWTPWFFEIF